MTTPKRLLLVLAILFSCVGCDQATKSVAKAYLSETHAVVLLGDTVRLQVAKNYGAFLSLGSSIGESSRGMLLSVVVGLVLAALLAYLFISKPQNPIVGVSIALIVGGGVSNLIDRLRYGGYVVDFLNVGIGPVRTGIFNVADMAIMVGVVLWAFSDRLWSEEVGLKPDPQARVPQARALSSDLHAAATRGGFLALCAHGRSRSSVFSVCSLSGSTWRPGSRMCCKCRTRWIFPATDYLRVQQLYARLVAAECGGAGRPGLDVRTHGAGARRGCGSSCSRASRSAPCSSRR